MKSIYLMAACVVVLCFAALSPVLAHHHGGKKEMAGHHGTSSGIKVDGAWARATPGLVKNGGAYFRARNNGRHGDRIVEVSSNMSAKTEMHTHINDKGVMRMRKVNGVDVPAGGEVIFKPGSYHIMFIGLHKPLKKGDRFPVTLMFEKAGKHTAEFTVMGVGDMKYQMKSNHTGH